MSSNAKLGATAVEDPFTNHSPSSAQRHRYSAFNSQQFSLYSNGSPSQVRRALEAHLSETERRLKEASTVGTQLLKQRQDISDQLQNIENIPSQDEIPPEMRQKLVSLEHEVSEVSRETARIFLPKSRTTSAENPHQNDPTLLSSHAQHSPSKLHAPSRKMRNQAPTRVNDVKLATEISDALLNQLRELQAAYAEKDSAWKEASGRAADLELDVESLRQRIRALDENEQRYKDENWSYEMKIQDLTISQKDASDRAFKLTQTLNNTQSEQAAVQREFEELKQAHGKLSEDHTLLRKQNDSEVSLLRRNADSSEAELLALHKKVDLLTTQNKELARAFAVKHRESEMAASQANNQLSGADDEDVITPEPSPPPSPSKATPRHGGLESETLKSSLIHAQRQIQHLKNTIHREKTEKFELKRMLQDSRDEIENKRKGAADNAGKKKLTKANENFKKQVRSNKLGASRDPSNEVIEQEDGDWEEHDETFTPSKSNRSSAAYLTAKEASDAFETANEIGSSTETDAFHTTAETLDGSDGEMTETEGNTTLTQIRPSNTGNFDLQSTASTSDDDDDDDKVVTPVQANFKIRNGRSSRKISPRSVSGTPEFVSQSSPVIGSSVSSTPNEGKSLFAELEDMSDGESDRSGTPQSILIRSATQSPEAQRKTPLPSRLRAVQSLEEKVSMVDASTMTELPAEKERAIKSITTIEKIKSAEQSTQTFIEEPIQVELIERSTQTPVEKRAEISEQSTQTIVDAINPPQISAVAQDTQKEMTRDSSVAAARPQIMLSVSSFSSQHSIPSEVSDQALPELSRSLISSQNVEPLSVDEDTVLVTLPADVGSKNLSEDSKLQSMTLKDSSTIERVIDTEDADSKTPKASSLGLFGSLFGLKTVNNNQSNDGSDIKQNSTSDGSGDLPQLESTKIRETLSESTQTMLSAGDIDELFQARFSRDTPHSPTKSGPRRSRELIRRPGSSGSNRSTISPPPPLPVEAKQVIAAATERTSSQPAPPSNTSSQPVLAIPGVMGPPIMPASAYNNKANDMGRPKTPASISSLSKARTSVRGSQSGMQSPVTRRSSITSFASELDQRFNIARSNLQHQPGTDPRIIQALTQTMIGEFLWKYTRKTGRDDFSSSRHPRYFWIHPYTRTLYWSEKDPSSGNRSELKAKSMPIELVKVVADDNPNPPGIYHKSIIVQTTSRPLKFTAPTSQRHETWFNALAYLLQQSDDGEEDQHNTFSNGSAYADPSVRSNSRMTYRSRASVGSSYIATTSNSRGVSPSRHNPTLRPNDRSTGNHTATSRSQIAAPVGGSSVSSRISSVFRTPQSFRASASGRSSSRASTHHHHDEVEEEQEAEQEQAEPVTALRRKTSAEAMRMAAVQADRRAVDMLENVRACCDGRHDVGSLTHKGRNSSNHHHHHHDQSSRSKRSSFTPSLSGSIATVGSRFTRKSDDARKRLEMMDPANIVS